MNRAPDPGRTWSGRWKVASPRATLVNRIEVDKETEAFAKLALERMLALP
ncbi:hypothetical protein LV779_20005 [Streptomyces thinghirensis]|nr:hypothetical protein [Streptomyces thinghirensis]